MSGRHARPGEWDDGALDSLLVLVAESLGYGCRRVPGDVMLLEGANRLHVSMRNLRQPPFDFPAPLQTMLEGCTEAAGKYQDKSLGLWRLSNIGKQGARR